MNKIKFSSLYTANSSLTLADWLFNWIETDDVKETTRQVYKGHIKNHINPKLGSIKLKALNADILQNFVNSLTLSPSTVCVVFSCLKAALMYAEEKGYISNIWSRVKLPKKRKNTVRVLSKTEQCRLEAILDDQEDIGIIICLYTGIRIGELCALRWEDIDFENSIMYVKRTQARVNNNIEFTLPKSSNSIRTIPIPGFLMNKLKKCSRESDFVVTNKGKYVDVRVYRRHFKALLKKAALPDIRFHALRHTFATRALEVGMDFKTLSEILGHSSTSITLDLYVHSLYEHKKNQMNKLSKIYNSPSK